MKYFFNGRNKKHLTEIKHDFDEFISKLDNTEERYSWLEDMLMETSQTEKQREKGMKKWNRISKNCGTTTKDVTYV